MNWNTTYILLLFLILIIFNLYLHRRRPIIFTCTTFFDFEKQDKWSAFCKAIDSILLMHDEATLRKIKTWIVVNEYSSTPRDNWSARIMEKYPFITFIQKKKNEKGQAASLNIILEKIWGYRYWIHWEETWYCRRPCLDRMIDCIENTNITQLQCTQLNDMPNWLDSDAHPRKIKRTKRGTIYYEIMGAPGTDDYCRMSVNDYNGDFVGHWPLYSLLPSINRVSHYNFGEFSTNPRHWPFIFEWDFARRWYLCGNKKAVLPDGPVVRDVKLHRSTYA